VVEVGNAVDHLPALGQVEGLNLFHGGFSFRVVRGSLSDCIIHPGVYGIKMECCTRIYTTG
jgi:hypothetical protein